MTNLIGTNSTNCLKSISRFYDLLDYRNGILTTRERINLIRKKEYNAYSYHFNYPVVAKNSIDFSAVDLLTKLKFFVSQDFEFLKKCNLLDINSLKSHESLNIIGDRDLVFVGKKCRILPNVYVDSTNGPVYIDDEVTLGIGTIVEGPCYIGKKSQLKSCRVSSSIFSFYNKISGEVHNCIFGDFSAKFHFGTVIDTIVGKWVNFAGGATTANLRLDYKSVALHISAKEKFDTGLIKFGAVVGDLVKLPAICVLGIGTNIDAVSFLTEQDIKGYYPMFYFSNINLNLDKLLEIIKKTFERRDYKVDSSFMEKLLFYWSQNVDNNSMQAMKPAKTKTS